MELFKNNLIYTKNTTFVLEHSKREAQDLSELDSWNEVVAKRYGDTIIKVLKVHEHIISRSLG